MIVIGISLAQSNLKELLFDKDTYIFLFFRMLLLPAAGILIFALIIFRYCEGWCLANRINSRIFAAQSKAIR